jgi:hypothetical protein
MVNESYPAGLYNLCRRAGVTESMVTVLLQRQILLHELIAVGEEDVARANCSCMCRSGMPFPVSVLQSCLIAVVARVALKPRMSALVAMAPLNEHSSLSRQCTGEKHCASVQFPMGFGSRVQA